jgi:hypothetical protein
MNTFRNYTIYAALSNLLITTPLLTGCAPENAYQPAVETPKSPIYITGIVIGESITKNKYVFSVETPEGTTTFDLSERLFTVQNNTLRLQSLDSFISKSDTIKIKIENPFHQESYENSGHRKSRLWVDEVIEINGKPVQIH